MQDYEETVSFLGRWGRFQCRIFFLLCLTAVPIGYNILSTIFLLDTPLHHCHIPSHTNLSQDWIQASIPVQEVNGQLERSSCSRYQLDLIQNLSALGSSPDDLSELKQEECRDGWMYNSEYFQSTVTTEFNLVCRDKWKQPLTSLMYFLGGVIGSLVSGPISDRFGRKPVLFGFTFLISFFSGTLAFAPSWPIFTLLFFMVGLGQITLYVVIFVLGSELLIGPPRVLFSNLGLPFVYVASTMLLPGSAYLLRRWRHLSIIMATPGLACMLLWWWVPESPRWLVLRGRVQEAELVVRSAAQENGVEAPPVIFLRTNAEKDSLQRAPSLNCLDLLRIREVRHITLILWVIWFSSHVCYFGMSFNSTGLHGNPYLNFVLLSAVEIPGYGLSWIVARSLPRRISFSAFLLLGALSLLLLSFISKRDPVATLSLVLLGKFALLGGVSVLFVFTGEIFPTIIRTSALSSCTSASRLGSALSPYLLQLAAVNAFLPWLMIGALSLLCVCFCVLLPETFGRPLPDTIHQMAPAPRFRWPCSTAEHDGKSTKDQMTAPEIICVTQL
ncbi:organic cation/carnitine transporter 2-like [Genypterus blacodes]|uniref:organic cation/carnitine transporter 2-like n=1 Tax=Genypterus blacodes TaxID=154954 RepID=UPI003F758F2A